VEIEQDIKELLSDKVEYIYSDVNYGKKLCSGGWIGAQSFVKGELIHNTGQDDVFTPTFYDRSISSLKSDKELRLTFSNGFKTDENLSATGLLLPVREIPEYYTNPRLVFNMWFGVGEQGVNEVTRANNNIPAPGVVYKKQLHEEIGLPDLDNFIGAGDFEYWARVLFNKCKCKYIPEPNWLYRCSNHSTSIGNDQKISEWVDKIKKKYYTLLKNEK
jgi:hypothetical protein